MSRTHPGRLLNLTDGFPRMSGNSTQRGAPPALPIKAALSRAATNAACDVAGASPMDVHGHLAGHALSSTPRISRIMQQYETARPPRSSLVAKQSSSSVIKSMKTTGGLSHPRAHHGASDHSTPNSPMLSQLTQQLTGFSLANTYPLNDPATCTPEELRLGPRAPRAIARLPSASKKCKDAGGAATKVPFLGDSCSSHPTRAAAMCGGGPSAASASHVGGSALASAKDKAAAAATHSVQVDNGAVHSGEEIFPAPPMLRRFVVPSSGPSSVADSISPPESPMSQEALDELWWGSVGSSYASSVHSESDATGGPQQQLGDDDEQQQRDRNATMQPLCVLPPPMHNSGATVNLPMLVETLWEGDVRVCHNVRNKGVQVGRRPSHCDGAHLIAWAVWDPRRCPPQGPLRSRQLLLLLEQRWLGAQQQPPAAMAGLSMHAAGGVGSALHQHQHQHHRVLTRTSSSRSADATLRLGRMPAPANVPTTARLLPYVGGGGGRAVRGVPGGMMMMGMSQGEDVEMLPMTDMQHGSQPIGIGGFGGVSWRGEWWCVWEGAAQAQAYRNKELSGVILLTA